MAHSFLIYIDESGDDGFGAFREPRTPGGRSHWLVLSALIVRSSRDLEAVEWRDEIKNLVLGKKTSRELHFRDLNHEQKVVAAQIMSTKPARLVSVLASKASLKPEIYTDKNQLYFYLCRYLLERLSWACRDLRPAVPEGSGSAKIIFSRRGGMSYVDFQKYLTYLRDGLVTKTSIHWPIVDIPSIEAKDHSSLAALQLADLCASSIAAAVEPSFYGNTETRYASLLKPIIYSHGGKFLGYGIKVFPKTEEINERYNLAELSRIFS